MPRVGALPMMKNSALAAENLGKSSNPIALGGNWHRICLDGLNLYRALPLNRDAAGMKVKRHSEHVGALTIRV
jgi:hypothetical protein